MKIFSVSQIRNCDQYTIENEPVSSIDLMERAAKSLSDYILSQFDNSELIIYCGVGNNGGDGLAVARILSGKGYSVQAELINYKETGTADFEINLSRLTDTNVIVNKHQQFSSLKKPPEDAIIIDALLGTGINKPVIGLLEDVIDFINKLPNTVISIDMPSGLMADSTQVKIKAIKANTTLTFQFPKLSFMFPENAGYVGEFRILDIGLNQKFIEDEITLNFYITKDNVSGILKPRKKFSHKGTYGHALLIAGSDGKYGSALLASKSCIKSGAGLFTLHSTPGIQNSLNVYLPSAMFQSDEHEHCITNVKNPDKYSAIAIGPGIGIDSKTANALKLLIQQADVPLILDADAINILSENKTWLSFLKPHCIFTPHPKEFERLIGKAADSIERQRLQLDFSTKYNCYVILKGAHTCITTPEGESYFNSTGNPGMAKGGSGDALTGILLGLAAQGINSQSVCLLGVYLHGLAGDIAKEESNEYSMTPEDMIECLPKAFSQVLTTSHHHL